MKKAYLVDFALLVRVVTDETDTDKIIKLAAEKLKREYPVSDIIENAGDPVDDIEVPFSPESDEGWTCTDSSDETLQFGKKNILGIWTFREWIDRPGEPVLSAREKIADWGNPNWREDTIDLNNYTIEERREAVSTYGYELLLIDGKTRLQSRDSLMSVQDSIQLISECIFELQM